MYIPLGDKNRMTFEQFVYWLRGYVEIDGSLPNDDNWKVIKEHLDKCFNHEPVSVYNRSFASC